MPNIHGPPPLPLHSHHPRSQQSSTLWADWDALPGIQRIGDDGGGSEDRPTEVAGPEADGRIADALLLTKHALRVGGLNRV